jgi:hypothetical protein
MARIEFPRLDEYSSIRGAGCVLVRIGRVADWTGLQGSLSLGWMPAAAGRSMAKSIPFFPVFKGFTLHSAHQPSKEWAGNGTSAPQPDTMVFYVAVNRRFTIFS